MKNFPLILALTTSVWASACASAPERPPAEEAVLAGSERVEKSRAAGEDAALAFDRYDVRVRFNPASCPCPDYEVHVFGKWMRVWLEGPPDAMDALATFAESAKKSRALDHHRVEGVLTDDSRLSEEGVPFPIFEIRE